MHGDYTFAGGPAHIFVLNPISFVFKLRLALTGRHLGKRPIPVLQVMHKLVRQNRLAKGVASHVERVVDQYAAVFQIDSADVAGPAANDIGDLLLRQRFPIGSAIRQRDILIRNVGADR
jgi:hypothetical protein